jgi:hypothetical protein
MCDIWINVLLQTSALVGPLNIVCPNLFINNYLARPIAKSLNLKYVEERTHLTTFIYRRYFKVFRIPNSIGHSNSQQAEVI